MTKPESRFSVKRGGDAAVFYLFLLAITLAFKLLYLRTVFGREGIARGLGLAPLSLPRFFEASLLFGSSDALQLAWIAVILVAVASLFRNSRRALLAMLFVAGFFGLLNWFACRQIATLVTREHLGVAWTWLSAHPGAASGFLSIGTVLRLVVAVAIGGVALLLAKRMLGQSRSSRMSGSIMLGAIAILACAGAFEAGRPRTGTETIVSTPYWSSAFASLTMSSRVNPLGSERRSLSQLRNLSLRMDHPQGASQDERSPQPLVRSPLRYVVIISLETAPLEYYPILNNPEFPTFAEMSRRGLTNTSHYTSIPRTTESAFSMMTGQYPVDDIARTVVGRKSRTTFLDIVARNGFETTFIDSYSRLEGWFNPSIALWSKIGFANVIFGTSDDESFEGMADSERRSFATALASIDRARSAGKGSLTLICSAIGHFPWPKRNGAPRAESPREATHDIAKFLDTETGKLVSGLEARGILDSSVIVVTGDHGLRFRAEFAAIGRAPDDPALTYNVPFILYAPGAVNSHVLHAPSSHIDIATTLLSLLGLPADSLLLHGRDLTSRASDDRAIYFSSVGLSPFDGMILGGRIYMRNTVTGFIERRDAGASRNSTAPLLSDSSVAAALAFATRTINESVAWQFSQPLPLK
jgi:hypothetical protein